MAGLKPASLPHTSSLIRSEERNSAMKGEEREQELEVRSAGQGCYRVGGNGPRLDLPPPPETHNI